MSNFNPISDRAANSNKLDEIFPLQKIIVFVFLLILSCVYLPCAVLSLGYQQTPVYFTLPAYLLVGASIAFLFLIIKKLLYSISCAIAIFFLYSYTLSPILPAAVAAIVLIFAIGGYLSSICAKKTYPLLILLPAVSYLGAYALTGRWEISLLAIAPLLASIIQGVLQRKNTQRKTIILASSITFLALLAAFAALLLYLNGKLSYTVIQTEIDVIRNGISEYMKNLSVELEGATVDLFENEYVDLFVTQVFNMLPSLVVVLTFATIYFSHSMQLAMYKSTDFDLMVTQKTTQISMSVYAASAFVLSYILSLSTDVSGSPDMLGVVAGNLCIILLPGLFIVGVDSFTIIIRKLKGFGFFAVLLLFVAFFMLSSYILYIVAAIGAFYIIVTSIDQWAKNHYSKKQL